MNIDWGDGNYETTARQLQSVAARLIEVTHVVAGEDVLDVGCGTGNVSLEAARRGAKVTAVDPSSRLIEQGKAKARAEGLQLSWLVGEAASLEAADRSFDVLLANFSVIFAPDPQAAVTEMFRVLRPGGRMAISTWVPDGAIFRVGELLNFQNKQRPPSPWSQRDSLRALLEGKSKEINILKEELVFEAPSARAWFDDVQVNHPVWRAVREASGDQWDEIRRRSLAILAESNEAVDTFQTTSRYFIAHIVT